MPDPIITMPDPSVVFAGIQPYATAAFNWFLLPVLALVGISLVPYLVRFFIGMFWMAVSFLFSHHGERSEVEEWSPQSAAALFWQRETISSASVRSYKTNF